MSICGRDKSQDEKFDAIFTREKQLPLASSKHIINYCLSYTVEGNVCNGCYKHMRENCGLIIFNQAKMEKEG